MFIVASLEFWTHETGIAQSLAAPVLLWECHRLLCWAHPCCCSHTVFSLTTGTRQGLESDFLNLNIQSEALPLAYKFLYLPSVSALSLGCLLTCPLLCCFELWSQPFSLPLSPVCHICGLYHLFWDNVLCVPQDFPAPVIDLFPCSLALALRPCSVHHATALPRLSGCLRKHFRDLKTDATSLQWHFPRLSSSWCQIGISFTTSQQRWLRHSLANPFIRIQNISKLLLFLGKIINT